MARIRIAFSGDHLDLVEIANFFNDAARGLMLLHDPVLPAFSSRFASMTMGEVARNLEVQSLELDMVASLSVLAAIEAAFRIDYLQRVAERPRDKVSRAMRDLYKEVENRAPLEDGILNIWRDNTVGSGQLISDLKGAFKYRHWLAHGRYWSAKTGRAEYDFQSIYQLADSIFSSLPLLAIE